MFSINIYFTCTLLHLCPQSPQVSMPTSSFSFFSFLLYPSTCPSAPPPELSACSVSRSLSLFCLLVQFIRFHMREIVAYSDFFKCSFQFLFLMAFCFLALFFFIISLKIFFFNKVIMGFPSQRSSFRAIHPFCCSTRTIVLRLLCSVQAVPSPHRVSRMFLSFLVLISFCSNLFSSNLLGNGV